MNISFVGFNNGTESITIIVPEYEIKRMFRNYERQVEADRLKGIHKSIIHKMSDSFLNKAPIDIVLKEIEKENDLLFRIKALETYE